MVAPIDLRPALPTNILIINNITAPPTPVAIKIDSISESEDINI
jgi:hypothetical protein